MAKQLSFSWESEAPEVKLRLLVTGASGFIGSFMVEKALEKGFEVWAGVRSSSSRAWLQDERIHFVELDYAHIDHLRQQLSDFQREQNGGWDYIIHCAGATKCPNKEVFYQTNFVGTRNFIDALIHQRMVPRQFIFLSSLGAWGPQHERMPHSPICADDEPAPNTAYGVSKLCVENYLQDAPGRFPWVIFRPTGVYGPREKDYFLMVKGIKRGFDFALGYKHQDITFIYVRDLVKAVFLAIDKGVTGRAYFISDGDVHSSTDFSELVRQNLGRRFVLRITAPLWLGRIACSVGSLYSRLSGRAVTLNNDKYRILSQRNWICDTRPLEEELGFHADYPLDRGVAETIAWYKAQHWI